MSSLAVWLTVGFLGQAFFTARFLVQWLASERSASRSSRLHSGGSAWWGGSARLSYAIFRRDPVIITGQAMGLFVYVRNLMLESKARRHAAELTLTLHSRVAGPASDRLQDQYQCAA